jgi:Domain of unknown function (DUF5925)
VPRRVHLTFNVGEGPSIGAALFWQDALDRGLTRVLSESWPTSAKLDESAALWWNVEPWGTGVLLELNGDALAFVHVGFGNADARVAAETEQAARAGMETLKELLPRAERDREGRVPVTFWTYSPHGPMPMGRTLSVPAWAEISANYAPETADPLARLMEGNLAWRGGQLILWHGETGTGKTTALRALAREWASWCDPHYITDPERFFGDQSHYMLSVILQQEMYGDEEMDAMEAEDGPVIHTIHGGMWSVPPPFAMIQSGVGSGERRTEARWRLLILEDTGELLAADARMQAGQGLSRFLNVVDGLIGQGLRILVLVTTNEELGALHPAISRPGRCAANVLFRRVPTDQANAWLREHGQEKSVFDPITLAALYAVAEGWDTVAERQALGFG